MIYKNFPPQVDRHCYAFGKWLAELSEEVREQVRVVALPRTLAALKGDTIQNAIALIVCVGFWTEEILAALDAIVLARDDEVGDDALSARVTLRSYPDEALRGFYLDKLHGRIPAGPNRDQVFSAKAIGTQNTAALIWTHWLSPPAGDGARDWWYGSVGRSLVGEIASRERDPAFAQQVWNWLEELAGRSVKDADGVFSQNSTLANHLDTPLVIPALIGRAVRSSGHMRYIYYLRASECARLAHMAGWDSVEPDILAAVIQDATGPTGMTGRFSTIELHRKEAAWGVLMCCGDSAARGLFGNALAGESGYVMQRLLALAACVGLDPFPQIVAELLAGAPSTQKWDDNERMVAQIGAIEAAHATENRAAFEALLGYRPIGPGVLLSLVSALAETARGLRAEGDGGAVEQLFQAAESSPRDDSRGAGVAAIAELLDDGVLNANETERAAALLTAAGTDPYARRALLLAFASRPPAEVPAAVIEYAERNRLSVEVEEGHDPRPAAILVLAQQPAARSNPEFLAHSLGLTDDRGALVASVKSFRGFAPHIIGQYFVYEPVRFGPAIATIIRDGDFGARGQLLRFVRRTGAECPKEVADALVGRLVEDQSSYLFEPAVLLMLAAVAPARLVTDGIAGMDRWRPESRVALADALGRLESLSGEIADGRLSLLARLAGDGIFAVRRAAYRAAEECEPSWFNTLASGWAQSGPMNREGARRYAAECAGWIRSPETADFLSKLRWDPEPGVRKAYERSLQEAAEREVAAEFDAHVLKVCTGADVVRAWRYGVALSSVADDTTIRRLGERLHDELPPAVRFWLKRLHKTAESRWKGVTKKWPEPWFMRPGRLEPFAGVIRDKNREDVRVTGTLWLMSPEQPGGRGDWGGWGTIESHRVESGDLLIPDRQPAGVVVTNATIPAGDFQFTGSGPYPKPVQQVGQVDESD